MQFKSATFGGFDSSSTREQEQLAVMKNIKNDNRQKRKRVADGHPGLVNSRKKVNEKETQF
jgi:hypothetical protein